ncbi:hypothetical protein [Paenibacillus glucanolyticus]|uniref:hypothetical protein n=1 Tax=Paenibacillus glucanolyticus TaxID=59843 RepID=UPI00096DD4EE|nr:hypothetical protein [Paenibacillus glucanolyticus]OMF76807.1 hypothetical protein BK142_14915 [Paenibacillus glucanolyticus]
MQYTFTVERNRQSVTQGTATVCLNNNEIVTFGDTIEMISPGHKIYGEQIGNYASVISDKDFIQAVLCPHDVNQEKFTNKIKKVLEKINEPD